MVDNGLLNQNFLYYSIYLLKFIVLFILLLITISAVYYFAPALHNKWKFISIGALFLDERVGMISCKSMFRS